MRLLENVSKLGLVVDLQDLFQRLTFDTTCILVMDCDPGCLPKEAVFICHLVFERVWKFQRWLGIGQEKKLRKACATISRVKCV